MLKSVPVNGERVVDTAEKVFFDEEVRGIRGPGEMKLHGTSNLVKTCSELPALTFHEKGSFLMLNVSQQG